MDLYLPPIIFIHIVRHCKYDLIDSRKHLMILMACCLLFLFHPILFRPLLPSIHPSSPPYQYLQHPAPGPSHSFIHSNYANPTLPLTHASIRVPSVIITHNHSQRPNFKHHQPQLKPEQSALTMPTPPSSSPPSSPATQPFHSQHHPHQTTHQSTHHLHHQQPSPPSQSHSDSETVD